MGAKVLLVDNDHANSILENRDCVFASHLDTTISIREGYRRNHGARIDCYLPMVKRLFVNQTIR